jgi:molybdate transport system substrate-binding protein
MKKNILAAAAMLAASALPAGAQADDLKVIVGAGMTAPIGIIAADFTRQTGTHVLLVSDTTGGVTKRLERGEKADLVLVTTAAMAGLARKNLVTGAHDDIARVMVGIAVRKGAPAPDISSPAAVRKSLLAAKSLAYVDPAAGGITGPFFAGLCRRMGIARQVAAKAVLEKNGGAVADAVARGKAALGITLVSELLPHRGVSVVGPLPDPIQIDAVYTASLTRNAAHPAAAKQLLARMRAAAGRKVIRQAGLGIPQ